MADTTTSSPFRLSRLPKMATSAPVVRQGIAPTPRNDVPLARPVLTPPPIPAMEMSAPTIIQHAPTAALPAAAAPLAPAAAGRLHVLQHPIAEHAMAALRDRRTSPDQFRAHCQRMLVLLLVEATRTLTTRERPTGWGREIVRALAKPVVVLSLRRDGLGLAHQMAECIPEAVTGVISLTTPEGDRPEPRLHLVHAPALSDARVIILAPVISTGVSACLALNLLRHSGATDVTLINLVTSAAGQSRILASQPGVEIWTGAVDPDWDPKIGPVPGLGDFAERLYDR